MKCLSPVFVDSTQLSLFVRHQGKRITARREGKVFVAEKFAECADMSIYGLFGHNARLTAFVLMT